MSQPSTCAELFASLQRLKVLEVENRRLSAEVGKTRALAEENARLTAGRNAAIERANTLDAKNRQLQAAVATGRITEAQLVDDFDVRRRQLEGTVGRLGLERDAVMAASNTMRVENTRLAALVVTLIDENQELRAVVRQADSYMCLSSE
jgi:hypothetical protein